MLASMVGAGTGLTSFRDNVGVLSITKVDSILLCSLNVIFPLLMISKTVVRAV